MRIFLDTYGEDFPYVAYKQEMRELFFGPYYEQSLTVRKRRPGAACRFKGVTYSGCAGDFDSAGERLKRAEGRGHS